ncbi:MAG: type II secretion system F family protein [Paracoccaceae bacterium]
MELISTTIRFALQNPLALSLVIFGLSVMVLFFAIARNQTEADLVTERMRRARASTTPDRGTNGLLKNNEAKPEGLLKALIPDNPVERTQIRMQLTQAGFDGPNALRNFFLARLGLALIGPVILLTLYGLKSGVMLPAAIDQYLDDMSRLRVLQIIMVSVAVGFYGPGYWLKARINARRARIEEGFPNSLDLLQISAAAGMGFDAAMQRVGRELVIVSPDISEEFMFTQREILAGRSRDQSLTDMANRMGIDEAISFSNVIIQSLQFGTSISDALTAYAAEMRETRELRAQEKANKLPVQMSAVMAVLMLPALLLITLGPTVIRYMRLD